MTPSRVGAFGIVLMLGLLAAAAIGRWDSTTETVTAASSAVLPGTAPSVLRAEATVATSLAIAQSTTRATAATPATVPLLDPVEVARGGLGAWGRFAASSDLDELAPWFSPDGPQWERFVEEAESEGVGPPAYFVSLTDEKVSERGHEVVVEGRVVFTRTGEASQSYWWRIVLASDFDEWRIWTVEEAG